MKLTEKLLWLMYPPRCPFCHRFLDGAMAICPQCEVRLPYIPEGMLDRVSGNVDAYYSVLMYKGNVRESIHRYKFGGLSLYAGIYAPLMCQCADENELDADIITWVPLSAQRKRKRGYDQAKLLAEPLAEYIDVPCVPLLKKIRNNPAQSGAASVEDRHRNVKGAYRYAGAGALDGKRIILVDDVVTTGSTLEECARVLKENGAGQILALTFACAMD